MLDSGRCGDGHVDREADLSLGLDPGCFWRKSEYIEVVLKVREMYDWIS
jgi:hypothetical protein